MGCLPEGRGASAAPAAAGDVGDVVLRAVTNNPKTSGHYRGLEIFRRLVTERTHGAVSVELYSDGVLGDEEQMVEGMRMGTVDVMMAAAAKYANFVPEMDLYSPPYTFTSWDHFRRVMESPVNHAMRRAVAARTGDVYLGSFTDGVRNVFTREPVRSLDELGGLQLRTMTGPNEIASWKALGTQPTPLAYTELYAALQAGVVDGAENTMTSLLGMKFYESCKYVLRTRHNFLALPFLLSRRALARLPVELRETVVEAGREATRLQVEEAIRMNRENEEVLKTRFGVAVLDLADEQHRRAAALCRPVQDANARRIGMAEELAEIRRLAETGS